MPTCTRRVLFLTARDLVRDRVKGLELGADDYLIKPFAFSELFARIRSILKRGPVGQESTVRIGDLEIDPRLHKALRAGRGLQLTTKEFTLLARIVQCAVKSHGSPVGETKQTHPGTNRSARNRLEG